MEIRFALLIVLLTTATVGCGANDDGSAATTGPGSAMTSTAPSPAATLQAEFTFEISYENTQTSHCPVDAIQFTDRSTGSPQTWAWTFPSGKSSTELNPVVTTSMWGTVTLEVTADGMTDRVSHDITTIEC